MSILVLCHKLCYKHSCYLCNITRIDIYAFTGQDVSISSDMERTGRNFACIKELVTYSCTSTGGSALFLSIPSLFVHAFTRASPVPDAVTFPSIPNVNLILTSGMPNYTAIAQIKMIDDPNQTVLNVTCSSGISGPKQVLPLIRECKCMQARKTA